MTQHYGFFYSGNNNVFASIQGVALISSTSNANNRPKGHGTYMYDDNIRRAIALFCVRSIPKHSWINSNNVYIGEPK